MFFLLTFSFYDCALSKLSTNVSLNPKSLSGLTLVGSGVTVIVSIATSESFNPAPWLYTFDIAFLMISLLLVGP